MTQSITNFLSTSKLTKFENFKLGKGTGSFNGPLNRFSFRNMILSLTQCAFLCKLTPVNEEYSLVFACLHLFLTTLLQYV